MVMQLSCLRPLCGSQLWHNDSARVLFVAAALPRSLAADTPYTTVLQLAVDGQPSNRVTLLIQ